MIRIRAERLRRGWSQMKLATIAGIHPSDVSRYENGHEMLLGHRHRIAKALGVHEERLYDTVELKVGEHA